VHRRGYVFSAPLRFCSFRVEVSAEVVSALYAEAERVRPGLLAHPLPGLPAGAKLLDQRRAKHGEPSVFQDVRQRNTVFLVVMVVLPDVYAAEVIYSYVHLRLAAVCALSPILFCKLFHCVSL
jgi:hypothetical protein